MTEETAASEQEAGSEPPIAVEGLSVSFGSTTVVDDVDVRGTAGTLVGLVGPNGAGKTTVLRAIQGTVAHDAGTIRLGGEDATELSARERSRRVASVPQETGLSFSFSVRHVVEMGRTPHRGRFTGPSATDVEAVERAMARASVEQFADRPITSLSGGERQRVVLARALAQETPALLLDEPTASLDVAHAVSTMALLRRLVDDGRAAIAAIHDLEMAARYCDQIVMLADGRVRAAGPPTAVLEAATTGDVFDVEAFVGENPATGSPTVTAFPRSTTAPRRVHVLGTGPRAARVVTRLAAAGHDLSLGVVPETDVAALAAADAGVRVVSVPPFDGVDADAREAATTLAAAADVTIAVASPGDGARDGAGVAEHANADVNADENANENADVGVGAGVGVGIGVGVSTITDINADIVVPASMSLEGDALIELVETAAP